MSTAYSSKHEQISSYIRDRIRSRNLRAGDSIPTEHELARMFACSRGTVQHALTMLVGEGLIRRRRGAGSFVAEQAETAQRTRIVLNVSDMGNNFISRFIQAMNLAAADKGYHMVLCNADGRRENDLRFLDMLEGPEVLGLVRFPSWVKSERDTRNRIRATGVRYVIIDDFWTDCWLDNHVAMDEETGIEMLITHLVQLGHRSIGFADLRVESTRFRAIEAFKNALKSRDLPCSDDQIVLYDPIADNNLPPLKKMYGAGKPSPTAIITPYESIANSLISVLHEMGMRVPSDVSVACLNGPGDQSGQRGMDITSAVPPLDRMIALALKILTDDSLDGVTQHYLVRPTLHTGRTSGPTPQQP